MTTMYRAIVVRLNCLGQDRSDIQYATKEICVGMARPTVGGMKKIKIAVRYLVGVKKVVWKMREWDDGEEVGVEVLVDSDLAKGRIGSRRVAAWWCLVAWR